MLIAFVLNYNLIIAHKYNLHRIYIKQWVNSSKFWSATGPMSEWYTLKLTILGFDKFKKFFLGSSWMPWWKLNIMSDNMDMD